MGLETGTGIGDLVPTNPLSTDAVSVGDDHIRLIKTVMQSITFLKSIQTFTTTGTWTRPANVKRILIYCLGGGGGGNGGTPEGYSGGGGSSGAIAIKWLDVAAISAADVTVGANGLGGAVSGLGTAGTATSFTTGGGAVIHCLAREGIPGAAGYAGGLPIARSFSTGDIVFGGDGGVWGSPAGGGHVFGGKGGGAGGAGTDTPSTCAAPVNSGGGGGGGLSNPSVPAAGGLGGSGYCIVLEFGW
jgi:hypothetical protein